MRGLLAVECLYHQIIAGNKTQTRRSGGLEVVNENPDQWTIMSDGRSYPGNNLTMVMFSWKEGPSLININKTALCKPRYKVGEVLYLKEPIMQAFGVTKYRYSEYEAFDFFRNPDFPLQKVTKKWSNKLFMPASAARAFIRITRIRCERLMAISNHDCIAEGIEIIDYADAPVFKDGSKILGPDKWPLYKIYHKMTPQVICISEPRDSFLSLYKFANKVKEVPNIWVWCYEIEYLKNYKHEQ